MTKHVAGLTPVDAAVKKYNCLNSAIVLSVPAFAVAYDTLERLIPMLRTMQNLLSQRPHGKSGDCRILDRVGGAVIGAIPVTRSEDLPTWSAWITAFGRQVGYSRRHLQRLILNEPRKKFVKECGLSKSDHDRLFAAAALLRELTLAGDNGVDTVALPAEAHTLMGGIDHLRLDEGYAPVRVSLRRRRPRKVTTEGIDLYS
jgi:hypothetical protein